VEAYPRSAPADGAEALATIETDPLIARRTVGLGRSVSLALPIDGRRNLGWGEGGASGVLAAAVRWVLPTGGDPRFSGEVDRRGDRPILRIRAEDSGRPMNRLRLLARVLPAGLDAPPAEVALEQVGPGRYEGALPAGACARPVVVQDDNGREVWHAAGRAMPPAEVCALGANWDVLRRLADRTGGRILPRAELTAFVTARRDAAYAPIWPWLAAAALGAMLFEWIVARRRAPAPA